MLRQAESTEAICDSSTVEEKTVQRVRAMAFAGRGGMPGGSSDGIVQVGGVLLSAIVVVVVVVVVVLVRFSVRSSHDMR